MLWGGQGVSGAFHDVAKTFQWTLEESRGVSGASRGGIQRILVATQCVSVVFELFCGFSERFRGFQRIPGIFKNVPESVRYNFRKFKRRFRRSQEVLFLEL